jgi:aerotaxis receptor
VRNIPAREEIAASEKLYAKVRNNELKHHRFYKGLLVRRGLFSFMSLFKCLSTGKRIHWYYCDGVTLLPGDVFIPDRLVQAATLVLLFLRCPVIFMRRSPGR